MLKDYPKEIILKDGTGVTLKPLQKGDRDLLFKLFNRLPENDRWFLDGDVTDSGLIENWVNKELEKTISIVAELEGRIIACAILIRNYYGARSHIGTIRISVDLSFREKNLGTWLLLELINLAISTGLETLVMELVEERDSYIIRSIKKLDFFEEAVLKDYVKDREGNTHNLIIMVKRLHQGWNHESQ